MSNLVKSLRKSVNNILKVRDDIGAELKHCYLVTRKWTGAEIGEGTFTDDTIEVLPSPYIVDYSHSIRLQPGGNIKQGDLLIRTISKETFPDRCMVNCSSDHKNIEKFYKVGKYLYNIINIKEKHLTWDVQVRRHSYQREG